MNDYTSEQVERMATVLACRQIIDYERAQVEQIVRAYAATLRQQGGATNSLGDDSSDRVRRAGGGAAGGAAGTGHTFLGGNGYGGGGMAPGNDRAGRCSSDPDSARGAT